MIAAAVSAQAGSPFASCCKANPAIHMRMDRFANLAGARRISMATLIRYAASRKLPLAKFFGAKNQLMPPIQISRH